jgi:carbon storage regulator
MLVLSRKRSEQIVIGSEIRITVVKLEGSQVRIGIEAPDDLTVLRAELLRDAPRWEARPSDPSRPGRDARPATARRTPGRLVRRPR